MSADTHGIRKVIFPIAVALGKVEGSQIARVVRIGAVQMRVVMIDERVWCVDVERPLAEHANTRVLLHGSTFLQRRQRQ